MITVDAVPVIKIIGSEMLATGSHLQAVLVVHALKSFHIANTILRNHSWILPWSLLASTPPWVPEYVHIWTPIC